MKCSSCGRENRSDAKFCTSCGVPMAASAPVSTPNVAVKKQTRSKSPFIIGAVVALVVVILGIILIPKLAGGPQAFVESRSISKLAFNMSVEQFIGAYNNVADEYLKDCDQMLKDMYRDGGLLLPSKSDFTYMEPDGTKEAYYFNFIRDSAGSNTSNISITECDGKVVSVSVDFDVDNFFSIDSDSQNRELMKVALILKVLNQSVEKKDYPLLDWLDNVANWHNEGLKQVLNSPDAEYHEWENNIRYTYTFTQDEYTNEFGFSLRAMTEDTYASWS